MKIITEKLVFGGKTLGKLDGKNVFVPFAIPGEELEINITESKKDYDNASIVKILKASPYRQDPPCKYYGQCGGCNMMHINPGYQQELRKIILEDIFAQNGIDIKEKTQVISGPDYNYRARFQLNDGGLSVQNSNLIVPIDKCLCAENVINQYFSQTSLNDRPKGRSHLFASQFSEDNEKVMLAYPKNIERSKETINPGKKKLKIKENHYFAGTQLSPENTTSVILNNKKLTFDVRGFFQSNLFVFEKVIKLILENLPGGKNILDMYAGCGSISSFLTDKYENVVLVEHNRDAIVYAEQNLNGKAHVSYGLSGANWVKNCAAYCGAFDACVIDPPRSGMEKEVCHYLCNSKIPLIVSMSCDPATHARDCAKLIKAGYKLEKAYLLDFYPNTSHIESLAIFKKNK
ncbi:MAG: methyltransferase [Treponema sp.]|nr:methyltransferase [Treponema sp.]